MKYRWIVQMAVLLVAIMATGCTKVRETVPDPQPSVYYWRTTFRLSDRERNWLKEQQIGKLYLHLFDITVQDGKVQPQATIRMDEELPQGVQIIPTVYIDEPVIRATKDLPDLAGKIVRRIHQMAETHGFTYREVQVDCDWTSRSQTPYFQLLEEMQAADSEIRLSATIRLHQLSMTPPPVAYGALMLYNTGDFRDDESGHNPILDRRDVGPYLRYLPDYDLPLCAAYPNFSWQLLFQRHEFRAILYGVDLGDSTLFHRLSEQEYDVINSRTLTLSMGAYSIDLIPGEKVHVWKVSDEELQDIHQLVEKYRPEINTQIITYTLDEKNL